MLRKNNFVLLEILIAFALVSVSILPFLRYPYRHMRQELDALFEMQLTRYAQERLCQIEEEICLDQIDLREFFHPDTKMIKWTPKLKSIALSENIRRKYPEKVTFERAALKRDGEFAYALIHIHLSYEHKKNASIAFHTEFIAKKKL